MVIVLHIFLVAMHVFIYHWVDYMGSEWFRDNLMDLFYIDINECSLSNGGCAQVCNNTIGSYVCSCNAGYNLENDNHTCSGYFYLFLFCNYCNTDINECQLNNGGCSHLCVNSLGSYQCQCSDGYQSVDENSINCTGI